MLFVRHAESYWNVSWMIGYTDANDRLTPNGIHQSKMLWRKLRRIIEATRLPVFVYVSESNRTLETALHSWIITSNTEFIIDPRLNEIEMGELTNIPTRDRKSIFDAVLTGKIDSFPSGEWMHHVRSRWLDFTQSRREKVLHLVFTHGVWIESITWRKKPKNASITTYPNN